MKFLNSLEFQISGVYGPCSSIHYCLQDQINSRYSIF